MNKRFQLLLFVAALLLAALACEVPGSGDPNILFEDDFSSTSSGWDRYSDEDGSTDYYEDSYRILINIDTFVYWSNPGKNFTDVIIEVDTSKIGGEEDNQLGIICRYADIDNFYALVISSDGWYGIRKRYQGGEIEFIGMDGMAESDAINQGNALNSLRAECVGNRLALFANGQQLFETFDGDITSGDVGLLAGTFSAANTDIVFDNFVVRKP